MEAGQNMVNIANAKKPVVVVLSQEHVLVTTQYQLLQEQNVLVQQNRQNHATLKIVLVRHILLLLKDSKKFLISNF